MGHFYVFTFAFILYFTSNPSSAEVEILNLFGELTVETGVAQDITCEVTEQEIGLDILWFVGERHLTSRSSVDTLPSGGLQQTLSYVPEIADHDLDLVCRYGTEQSKLNIKTYTQQIISTSRVHMVDDKTGQIFLLAKVFPPPTVRNVLWTVEAGGGVKRMVRPGDNKDGLSAEVIQREDDHTYKFLLDIAGDKEEISATNVTLALSTGQKMSETQFDMQLMAKLTADPTAIIEVKSDGIQWWIWLCVAGAVIVFIIVIIIIIIVIMRRCRKPETVTQKSYTSHLGNIYLKPAHQQNTDAEY